MQYAGLTDYPQQRRQDHGNPVDWRQISFSTEAQARTWERTVLAMPGYTGGTGGTGWKYGYTYKITYWTKQ